MPTRCVVHLGIVFIIILSNVFSSCLSDDFDKREGSNSHYDNSWSWKKAFIDLGVYDIWMSVSDYVRGKIQTAQAYTDQDLLTDWNAVRNNPSIATAFNFLRNASLPLVVRFLGVINTLWSNLYFSVMKFTRKKCDSFLGKQAPLHPWNVVKLEKETVSMLVFLYGIALSLILMKLCSFWNFLAWLALGYLAYAIGGPYWLFRWLVFLTGFFWYMFDMILTYPYYCVSIFMAVYVYYFFATKDDRTHLVTMPREFKTLSHTVGELERKTDLIQGKIDRLTNLMEKYETS